MKLGVQHQQNKCYFFAVNFLKSKTQILLQEWLGWVLNPFLVHLSEKIYKMLTNETLSLIFSLERFLFKKLGYIKHSYSDFWIVLKLNELGIFKNWRILT